MTPFKIFLKYKERINSNLYYFLKKFGVISRNKSNTAAVIFSRFCWENKEWENIGSGRMQKSLIKCFNELGFTTFFAGQEDDFYKKNIWASDIIVTTSFGLAKLPRLSGKTCLFTCNTFATIKKERLLKASKIWGLSPENDIPEEIFLQAYKRADYLLIAENERGIQNFVFNGIPKIKIYRYNNAIDSEIWLPNNQKRDKFTFVCWSSELGLRKGLPVLIDAWKKWYKGQDAELYIIGMPTKGTDHYFGDLREGEVTPGLVVNLKIFPTWHKPLIEFIGSCHVAVFPTLEDAQPSCLLEMASCGLPVITTHESGVEFNENFCFYVNCNDPESLEKGFDYWFQRKNDVPFCGKLAREYIRENHSWLNFQNTFKAIVLDIVSKNN